MITMTPELVEAMSQEAGNRSMLAAGRTRWNWQDWTVALAAAASMWRTMPDD